MYEKMIETGLTTHELDMGCQVEYIFKRYREVAQLELFLIHKEEGGTLYSQEYTFTVGAVDMVKKWDETQRGIGIIRSMSKVDGKPYHIIVESCTTHNEGHYVFDVTLREIVFLEVAHGYEIKTVFSPNGFEEYTTFHNPHWMR